MEQRSFYTELQYQPQDEVIQAILDYRSDTSPKKIDLTEGVYAGYDLKPYTFEIVKRVRSFFQQEFDSDMGYCFAKGMDSYIQASQRVVFSEELIQKNKERIVSAQTISGAGALRIGFDFIKKFLPQIEILIPKPTWGNHKTILNFSGLKYSDYPYYDKTNQDIDFLGMVEKLKQSEKGTAVLLHACAHNPTGLDLNKEQWKQLAIVFKQNNLLAFFDCAYQGFASGDMDEDAFPVRLFLEERIQMIVSYTFSKNMGIYGERAGAIHFITLDKESAKIDSNLIVQIRGTHLSPPKNIAKIVSKIILTPEYYEEWIKEQKTLFERMIYARKLLRQKLEQHQVPGDWSKIEKQKGMFFYTGFSYELCQIISKKYHVHLVSNGRMNICGISDQNVDYLVDCFKNAIDEENQQEKQIQAQLEQQK